MMGARRYGYGKLFQPASGGLLIERKARRALSFCLHKLGLSEVPLPIPVDRWIETAFDIRFGIADLSHIGSRVLGASFLRDREILISDKALFNEGRYRFTCAHELAHFRLHMHIRDQFSDDEEPEIVFDDEIERQADRFAAAFLMPVNLFEREVLLIAQGIGADPEWCLSELMMASDQSLKLWQNIFVPALSRSFGVSKTAALIRAHSLELIYGEPRTLIPTRFFYDLMPKPIPPVAEPRAGGA
ncbi:MAG: ImmA/IrrE family metallo-endopeptidase [Phycisphaerales bacterium]|nr:ImmA/IrrE family metallo-endopeptidase [Phycisphaerales bacterium]